MFNEVVDKPFLSCELTLHSTKETYSLDINSICYFYKNNRIFFKEHVIYTMNKQNVHINKQDSYTITIIDHNCDVVTISNEQCIVLTEHNNLLYRIDSTIQ